MTRTTAFSPDPVIGVKAVVVTVYQNGDTDTVVYPASYDGKAHAVSGATDRDGILMQRVNEYTADSVVMHAGVRIAVTRRTVSVDSKTMTITCEGILNGWPNGSATLPALQP